jgi:hypothetical protein
MSATATRRLPAPSAAEIRRRAAEVRQQWSSAERNQRRRLAKMLQTVLLLECDRRAA